jgi:hypothetical protein
MIMLRLELLIQNENEHFRSKLLNIRLQTNRVLRECNFSYPIPICGSWHSEKNYVQVQKKVGEWNDLLLTRELL